MSMLIYLAAIGLALGYSVGAWVAIARRREMRRRHDLTVTMRKLDWRVQARMSEALAKFARNFALMGMAASAFMEALQKARDAQYEAMVKTRREMMEEKDDR